MLGGRLQSAIAAYEAGRNAIPESLVFPICRELGIRAEWFLEGIEPKMPEVGPYHPQFDKDESEVIRKLRGIEKTGTSEQTKFLSNILPSVLLTAEELNAGKKKRS